jgi:uncharacterized SAM-binding protein YcdF (DUF218 family)
VIKFFLDPFNIFLILAISSALFFRLSKKKTGKLLVLTTFAWFLVISTPLVPTALLSSLEDRYHPIGIQELSDIDSKRPYNIIVLGGGHGYDDRLPPNSLLSSQALARLNEGIRLHNALPNSRLVLSGYSAISRVTQAEMLKQTALILGVAPEAIETQPEPGNTTEEAKVYSEYFGAETPVILVTSAAHMPRAAGVFSFFGIDTIASPAHYRILESGKSHWIGWPSVSNISNMRTGIYEYAAITRDQWLN